MAKPRLPRRHMPPTERTFTDRKKQASKEACRGHVADKVDEYRANFLWPHDDGSIEAAGYEFANGSTEAYRKVWWDELVRRIEEDMRSRHDISGEDE